MDLQALAQTLRNDALAVVFLNVLLQQLGLPLPVLPTLLVAGSLMAGPGQLLALLAVAVLASVLADGLWYAAGRRFGYRVLAGLCRLSINPASCVNETESRFLRWGVSSLVVAKFVPGFSTVAPPIAGALRMRLPGFLLAAGAGAALWAGLALATGWWLQGAVQALVLALDRQSGSVALALAIAAAAWLAWKLWQRRRFQGARDLPWITAEELLAELAGPTPPLLLDLRGATMAAETGRLPGARAASHDRLDEAVADWPRDRPIVTLCACPEDAGAVAAARALLQRGYRTVRPLQGGHAAWVAAGIGAGAPIAAAALPR
ncbi:MAG: VTT domain-containing protein [Burkholderiaceae bacterium]|nr:VTT domain-containing protein [Burkholderiaceae bacterium]